MPTNKVPKTTEEFLIKKIEDLEKRIKKLENSQRPTVPIYDSTALPADAVEGQLAIIFTP